MKPGDFDAIFTGDLGFEGHSIVNEMMCAAGINISDNYRDCGLIIYDREGQDMHAGGSGCGCSARCCRLISSRSSRAGSITTFYSSATGALMSPMLVLQGQSIPGIAPLVRITKERNL